MNVNYLKNLRGNLNIAGTPSEGVTEAEIVLVEAKFNVKFPEAYREYLLLAGKYKGGLIITSTSLKTVSSDWFHELMKELMSEWGVSIDKPYWIFAHEDDFYFFYLEKDVEDPLVYYTYPQLNENSNIHKIVPYNKTFSEFINDCINYSIKGHETGIF